MTPDGECELRAQELEAVAEDMEARAEALLEIVPRMREGALLGNGPHSQGATAMTLGVAPKKFSVEELVEAREVNALTRVFMKTEGYDIYEATRVARELRVSFDKTTVYIAARLTWWAKGLRTEAEQLRTREEDE